MNKSNKKIITHVSCLGFADVHPGDSLFKDAYEVGEALAKAGYVVVNGGGPGVMRASSEGAKAGGGHVIGATFYPKDITNFEGRDKNNPIDEEIITNNYLERTLKLLELGQVYVIFQGGTGTISEFGMAWGLARLYFGHHKPLILYGKFWEKIISTFLATMKMRPEEFQVYTIATNPEEVVEALQIFELRASQMDHSEKNPAERAFQI